MQAINKVVNSKESFKQTNTENSPQCVNKQI